MKPDKIGPDKKLIDRVFNKIEDAEKQIEKAEKHYDKTKTLAVRVLELYILKQLAETKDKRLTDRYLLNVVASCDNRFEYEMYASAIDNLVKSGNIIIVKGLGNGFPCPGLSGSVPLGDYDNLYRLATKDDYEEGG